MYIAGYVTTCVGYVVGIQPTEGTTTWYASVFIVINAALGAGLLEFPYAFSQSGGVMAALVVQGVCLLVTSILIVITVMAC